MGGEGSGQFKIGKHEQQSQYNFPCDLVFSFRMEEGNGLSYPEKLMLKKKQQNCEIVISTLKETSWHVGGKIRIYFI